TEMMLQATSYAHAVQQRYEERPGVRYVVLVKTKKPQVQYLETIRTDADISRLGDVVQAVERAIQAEAFYPVESTMNCSGCAFYRQCRQWRGCNSLHTIQKPEAVAC
ncbi:MAG: PD-(D/E)XK nuclease family protein, partial [Thermoguttaceae bacterium]